MAYTISAETPKKMGSGYVWLEEVDDDGATKSGGTALTRFFILKDAKLVNKATSEEVADAGGEKYTLDSAASYAIEGTVLSNSANVDGFIQDKTKKWRMIFEGSRTVKANNKIDYWYFGIVQVSEITERSFTGTERTLKLNVYSAGTAITYTAPSSGGLPGSKVSTVSLEFTQPQAAFYVVKEST